MKKHEKEYILWLRRAIDDLAWTESNIREKVYYGACFTAQQAVEKVLKAFLLYKQGRFDKVHDLVKLLEDCSKHDGEFHLFQKAAAKFSFYYVQSRYPDISEIDIFTTEEAEDALIQAKKIVEFVSEKLSVPIR